MSSESEAEFASASEGEEYEGEKTPTNVKEPKIPSVRSPSPNKDPSSPQKIAPLEVTEQSSNEENPKHLSPDSTSPTKSPSSRQEIPPVIEPPTQATSWNSWGTFFSSAVAAVQESIAADVDGIVSTVSEIGDKVYATLDDKRKVDFRKPNNEGTEQIETNPLLNSTETVLQAIDKTFDFTSDLLGGAVLGGYNTIKEAKLSEKFDELSTNVGNSKVLSQSKAVGGTLVSHGLTALEAIGSVVGSKAAETLVSVKKLNQAQNETDKGSKVIREMTLQDFFENNCGNAHLQALEMLSTESGIKAKSTPQTILEKCAPLLKSLEKPFDVDDMLEDIVETDESVLLNEDGYNKFLNLLKELGISNQRQAKNLSEFLRVQPGIIEKTSNDFKKLIESALETENKSVSLNSAATTHLKTLKNHSIKSLADLSEMACEQLLRVAEIFLMQIAEERLKHGEDETETREPEKPLSEQAVNFANALRELTFTFLSELQWISSQYISAINNFSQTYQSNISSIEESSQSSSAVEQAIKDLSSQFELDTSNSMSYIQEAMCSMQAILKLMITSSVSLTHENKD